MSFKDGLTLERTAKVTDISFVLENSEQRAVDLPLAPRSWTKKGPFFIKVPSKGWLQLILKKIGYFSETYIVMSKCDEPSKPQYKAVTEKNIENEDLMLFTINCQLIDNNELLRKQPATDNNELPRKQPATDNNELPREQPAIEKPPRASHPPSLWNLAGTLVIIIGATLMTSYHYPLTVSTDVVSTDVVPSHAGSSRAGSSGASGFSEGKREYRRRLP